MDSLLRLDEDDEELALLFLSLDVSPFCFTFSTGSGSVRDRFFLSSSSRSLFLSGFRSFLVLGGETGSDFSLLCFRSSLGELLRSLLRFLAESSTGSTLFRGSEVD